MERKLGHLEKSSRPRAMTYRWKQILAVCACVCCAGALLLTGYAHAGATEVNRPDLQGREGPLAPGSWGGQHISLEVTADGGIAEYDCAHSTISQRITLDRRGRFNVPGTYTAEHGGPVREGQQTESIPVQFSGRVSETQMYLTIRRRGSGKLLGNFTLVLGQEPSLVKCR
jgi:hypothetical protein